jgi:hypothetical protein
MGKKNGQRFVQKTQKKASASKERVFCEKLGNLG